MEKNIGFCPFWVILNVLSQGILAIRGVYVKLETSSFHQSISLCYNNIPLMGLTQVKKVDFITLP